MTSYPPYGQPPPGQPGQPFGGQGPAGPGQPGPYPGPGYQPGAPAHGWSPPPYAGYPAAGYGQPGFGGAPGPGRPGQATAAAVLAFVFGAAAILQSLFGVLIGSLLSGSNSVATGITDTTVRLACDRTLPDFSQDGCDLARQNASRVREISPEIGTFAIVVAIGAAIVAALMIWGGVVLLSGRDSRIVVSACALYFLLAILLIVATRFGVVYAFGIVLPVLITVFTLNGSTRAWVRSRGGRTF
ncbi:hypothetical protein [Nakamurella endophytica]|uniref:Uncharacterized protein n=1 Tax=Nakamurella endophytica TaxID=1748367 RepID=A0A917WAQ2_9ACTN|nr:hypothetical protein [Nakamurella endophytica]GGL85032.1 hypothetical protein GCM10011594_00820 [Nakamurella endophytica]